MPRCWTRPKSWQKQLDESASSKLLRIRFKVSCQNQPRIISLQWLPTEFQKETFYLFSYPGNFEIRVTEKYTGRQHFEGDGGTFDATSRPSTAINPISPTLTVAADSLSVFSFRHPSLVPRTEVYPFPQARFDRHRRPVEHFFIKLSQQTVYRVSPWDSLFVACVPSIPSACFIFQCCGAR